MPSSEASKFYYVYVLESQKSGEHYIGCTNNLIRRFVQHNSGLNISTKPYRPWRLIYYEACIHPLDAERRERYFKKSEGRRLLKRRLKEYGYRKK